MRTTSGRVVGNTEITNVTTAALCVNQKRCFRVADNTAAGQRFNCRLLQPGA
jgi:hypothetical protein